MKCFENISFNSVYSVKINKLGLSFSCKHPSGFSSERAIMLISHCQFFQLSASVNELYPFFFFFESGG